tara:strand:- start:4171 stop:4563 length:393 start_codon:yes stop_codon:yes gene_type:complete
MSALSDYAENKVLNALLGNATFTTPSNVYVGLATASFNDDGSGTELSGNNYSRVSASFTSATGTGGTTSNSSAIEFAAATGSWGSVSHFGLFDASTSGNLLCHGAFSSAKTITTGDILRIATGELDVTIA